MTVYTKTDKGRTEIANPSGKLNPKLRRLLILSNGTLDDKSLARAISKDNADTMLAQLVNHGYIEEHDTGLTPMLDDFIAKLPEVRSPSDFEKAKNYMINTIGHFHGQYGQLALKNDINNTENVAALRKHYPAWAKCMLNLKQFKKLNKELLKVL